MPLTRCVDKLDRRNPREGLVDLHEGHVETFLTLGLDPTFSCDNPLDAPKLDIGILLRLATFVSNVSFDFGGSAHLVAPIVAAVAGSDKDVR